MAGHLRSGDDDIGVNELPVKGGVLAFLVGGGYEGVARILEPLAEAKLVLSRAQELGDLKWRTEVNVVSPTGGSHVGIDDDPERRETPDIMTSSRRSCRIVEGKGGSGSGCMAGLTPSKSSYPAS